MRYEVLGGWKGKLASQERRTKPHTASDRDEDVMVTSKPQPTFRLDVEPVSGQRHRSKSNAGGRSTIQQPCTESAIVISVIGDHMAEEWIQPKVLEPRKVHRNLSGMLASMEGAQRVGNCRFWSAPQDSAQNCGSRSRHRIDSTSTLSKLWRKKLSAGEPTRFVERRSLGSLMPAHNGV